MTDKNQLKRDIDREDAVIEAMKRDYISGRWTLEQLEEMIGNRLEGRTPVDAEGWPLYYEPSLLDGTEMFAE